MIVMHFKSWVAFSWQNRIKMKEKNVKYDTLFVLNFNQDNDLSEFDESRDIIESLVDEYKACESPDYIKWGMEVMSPLIYFPCCLN